MVEIDAIGFGRDFFRVYAIDLLKNFLGFIHFTSGHIDVADKQFIYIKVIWKSGKGRFKFDVLCGSALLQVALYVGIPVQVVCRIIRSGVKGTPGAGAHHPFIVPGAGSGLHCIYPYSIGSGGVVFFIVCPHGAFNLGDFGRADFDSIDLKHQFGRSLRECHKRANQK